MRACFVIRLCRLEQPFVADADPRSFSDSGCYIYPALFVKPLAFPIPESFPVRDIVRESSEAAQHPYVAYKTVAFFYYSAYILLL